MSEGESVLVVGTLAEGKALGARLRGRDLRDPEGRLVLSVSSQPYRVHGLRVKDFTLTALAASHINAFKWQRELRHSQLRTTGDK